jgi:hypothetical protein
VDSGGGHGSKTSGNGVKVRSLRLEMSLKENCVPLDDIESGEKERIMLLKAPISEAE